MHPALPLATEYLSAHTAGMVQLLEKRSELSYGLQLARMLQQVISHTTTSITEKQIEAILSLTRQTHDALAANLNHYMEESKKFTEQYCATTSALSRAELDTQITNIGEQMKAIRSDMDELHRFSARVIGVCGREGLNFVRDLSLPLRDNELDD